MFKFRPTDPKLHESATFDPLRSNFRLYNQYKRFENGVHRFGNHFPLPEAKANFYSPLEPIKAHLTSKTLKYSIPLNTKLFNKNSTSAFVPDKNSISSLEGEKIKFNSLDFNMSQMDKGNFLKMAAGPANPYQILKSIELNPPVLSMHTYKEQVFNTVLQTQTVQDAQPSTKVPLMKIPATLSPITLLFPIKVFDMGGSNRTLLVASNSSDPGSSTVSFNDLLSTYTAEPEASPHSAASTQVQGSYISESSLTVVSSPSLYGLMSNESFGSFGNTSLLFPGLNVSTNLNLIPTFNFSRELSPFNMSNDFFHLARESPTQQKLNYSTSKQAQFNLNVTKNMGPNQNFNEFNSSKDLISVPSLNVSKDLINPLANTSNEIFANATLNASKENEMNSNVNISKEVNLCSTTYSPKELSSACSNGTSDELGECVTSMNIDKCECNNATELPNPSDSASLRKNNLREEANKGLTENGQINFDISNLLTPSALEIRNLQNVLAKETVLKGESVKSCAGLELRKEQQPLDSRKVERILLHAEHPGGSLKDSSMDDFYQGILSKSKSAFENIPTVHSVSQSSLNIAHLENTSVPAFESTTVYTLTSSEEQLSMFERTTVASKQGFLSVESSTAFSARENFLNNVTVQFNNSRSLPPEKAVKQKEKTDRLLQSDKFDCAPFHFMKAISSPIASLTPWNVSELNQPLFPNTFEWNLPRDRTENKVPSYDLYKLGTRDKNPLMETPHYISSLLQAVQSLNKTKYPSLSETSTRSWYANDRIYHFLPQTTLGYSSPYFSNPSFAKLNSSWDGSKQWANEAPISVSNILFTPQSSANVMRQQILKMSNNLKNLPFSTDTSTSRLANLADNSINDSFKSADVSSEKRLYGNGSLYETNDAQGSYDPYGQTFDSSKLPETNLLNKPNLGLSQRFSLQQLPSLEELNRLLQLIAVNLSGNLQGPAFASKSNVFAYPEPASDSKPNDVLFPNQANKNIFSESYKRPSLLADEADKADLKMLEYLDKFYQEKEKMVEAKESELKAKESALKAKENELHAKENELEARKNEVGDGELKVAKGLLDKDEEPPHKPFIQSHDFFGP